MNQQAQFTASESGEVKVIWDEAQGKPVDTSKLQGGMFVDRPDLWRKQPTLNDKRYHEWALNNNGEWERIS